MDERIINAIKECNLEALKNHPIAEVGFSDSVRAILEGLEIINLSDFVTYPNKRKLLMVIDTLSAEERKNFFSLCRKLNIRISDEITSRPRRVQEEPARKAKLLDIELFSKFIASATENHDIAWAQALKGTAKGLAINLYKTIFRSLPPSDIRRVICYYSIVCGEAFNKYTLKEHNRLGIDNNYKDLSLILMYIKICVPYGEEDQEFIVYQLTNENDYSNFQGLLTIKKEQLGEDAYRLIKDNIAYFSTASNEELEIRTRLTMYNKLLRTHRAMNQHYLYILSQSGRNIEDESTLREKIEILKLFGEKTIELLFASELSDIADVLPQIEQVITKKILPQDSIDELDLSIRSYNCLTRAGIMTIEDLTNRTEEDMIKVRNLGKKSLEEVVAALAKYGYTLKDDEDETNVDPARREALLEEVTIEELDLSVRAFNCLKRRGCNTIEDVRKLTFGELAQTRNLSHAPCIEILCVLFDKGIRLKDFSIEKYDTIEEFIVENYPEWINKFKATEEHKSEFRPALLNRHFDFEKNKNSKSDEATGCLDGKSDSSPSVKEDSLEARSKVLDDREAELEAREASLNKREQELDTREGNLHVYEAQLAANSSEFSRKTENFDEWCVAKKNEIEEAELALEEKRKKLASDIEAYNQAFSILAQRQAEFGEEEVRIKHELEEEQKKLQLTKLIASLEAVRSLVELEIGKEKSSILEGAKIELERLKSNFEAEIQRIQSDAEARIKAKGVECDSLIKATEKKVADKAAELDKTIKDINSLVVAMKKVIADVLSEITTRISALQRTKTQLNSEANELAGMFNVGQKKILETRIQQIDSELLDLNAVKRIIDDYNTALNYDAMKTIELSFTTGKSKPKTSPTKLFSFVETSTSAAIEKFVGFNESEVVIPDMYNGKPVTVIASSAFAKCHSLKRVVLGKNVRKISDYAFSECDSLESVKNSDQLTQIYSAAFAKCKKLKDFEFGANLEVLEDHAFSETAIVKFILPPKITEIKRYTFERCPKLKTVIFHDRLRIIREEAFSCCASLEIVELPISVQKVSPSAFGGVIDNNLRELRVLSRFTDFVKIEKKEYGFWSACNNTTVYCYADSKAQEFFRSQNQRMESL